MAKYGRSAAEIEDMDFRMEQTAAADHLEYHLSAEGLTGNTFDAHRLVHLARDRGRQDAVVERFFHAYFTEQRSLFDQASLTALAIEAGLDGEEVRRVLSDGTYGDAVSRDLREAQALGATGFFVIDSRYRVSGAQPVGPAVLARAVSGGFDRKARSTAG